MRTRSNPPPNRSTDRRYLEEPHPEISEQLQLLLTVGEPLIGTGRLPGHRGHGSIYQSTRPIMALNRASIAVDIG